VDRRIAAGSNQLTKRVLSVLLACVLVIGQQAFRPPQIVRAATGAIQYVYDASSRLIGVVDPASQTAKMSYDASGNITAISRYNSTTVSIIGATPTSGTVGAAIKIYGTNYSTTPSQNTVTFNGVAATVSASTFSELTVSVPAGATTGTLRVTSPGGTATSSFSFTVFGSRTPTISGLSATVVDAGAQLTVSGTNFQTAATNDEVVLGSFQTTINSATSSSLVVTAPPVGAGVVTVVTPYGKGASTADVFVPPSPYLASQVGPTGRAQVGQTTSLTFNTGGKIGLLALDLTVGQRISFLLDESQINGCCNNFALYNFDGTLAFQGGAGFRDVMTVPVTGTYLVLIAPGGQNTGTARVTVYSVPPDVTTSMNFPAVGASSQASVTNTTAGQDGTITFSIQSVTPGMRIAMNSVPAGSNTNNMFLTDPSGTQLYGGGMGVWTDVITPTVAGTYTIKVDFLGNATGTASVTLYNVPVDSSSSLSFPAVGSSVVGTATSSTPGQDSKITFDIASVTPGMRIAINGVPAGSNTNNMFLTDPNGTQLVGGGMGWTDVITPTVAGTYSIKVDFLGMATGTATATLYNVPVDSTTNVTFPAVGSSVQASATTTTPGQDSKVTFDISSVTPGMRIAINGVQAGSNTNNMFLTDPNGTQLFGGGMGWTDLLTPTVAGTYTIRVDFLGMATGTATATLYNVPADATTGMSFPAPGSSTQASVTTTTPAQNATVTFDATSGSTVTFTFDESGISGCCNQFTVLNPSGSTLSSTGAGGVGPLTLPETGTYTIKINYSGLNVGTAAVTLTAPVFGMAERSVAGLQGTSVSPISDRDDPPKPDLAPTTKAAAPAPSPTTGGGQTGPALSQAEWAPRTLKGGNLDYQIYTPLIPNRFKDLRAPPGVTALAGQSLQLDGKPLAGVTFSIGTRTARTDGTGRFLLAQIPSGRQILHIDGTTANHKGAAYGNYEVAVQIVAGKTNSLGFTNWMTQLDMAHATTIPSPTKQEVVVTTPLIPGLEVHLPTGTVIKDDDGHVVTQLSITPIPVNRPPFPLPLGVQVPIYFTVQPGSTYIYPKGATLVYPNYAHQAPGARVEFWNYDPDDKGWYVYGHGTVTRNGKQVVPDPGVVIYEFSGAMINSGFIDWLIGKFWDLWNYDGDPVNLNSGIFVHERTDLVLPGPMPITFNRVYNSNDTVSRSFGIGATHSYDINLFSTNQYQVVALYLPGFAPINYVRISPGTGFADAVFQTSTTPGMFYKSTITWNGNGWNLRLRDGTTYVFGENAPLQSINDRFGNQITLIRSQGKLGNVTAIISSSGRWIKLAYDGSNRITQALDNTGRTVVYGYDASGRLQTVTDPIGGHTTFGYDSNNRMTTVTDPRNFLFLTNHYDANGRVYQQDLVNTSQHYSFAYTIDANGKVTQTEVTDPRGIKHKMTFNSDGFSLTDVADYTGPTQQTTQIQRQTGTNLVDSITDPLGRVTQLGYDSAGNVNSLTEMLGTPDARTIQLTYETTYNRLRTYVDPRQKSSTIDYDDTNRTATVTDAVGHQTTVTLNSAGQVLSVRDPLQHTWTYGYTFGDLTQITDPVGATAARFLDGGGRVVASTDALGQLTLASYDALNQMTSVANPLGGTTAIAYDPNGNVTSVQDARLHSTLYTYDSSNRLLTRTDPNMRVQNFNAYDADGNLTYMTDQKGQKICITYDNLNRPTFVGFAANAPCPSATSYQSSLTYTWDLANRIHLLTDSGTGTVTEDWDNFDRPKDEITAQGTVTFTFDVADRLQTVAVPGQTSYSYTYDDANRLQSIKQGATTLLTKVFDNADRLTSQALPDGIVETYAYDNSNQLTGITYTKGATTLGNLAYALDPAGRVSTLGGTWARTNLPAALTSATYDSANQVITRGNKTFTYDANGNLTNDGTNPYTWNARNQLTSVGSGGARLTFTYDALGRRLSSATTQTTTSYLYVGDNPVQEIQSGVVKANQIPSPTLDEDIGRTDSSGTSSYLTDRLGSTVALANSAGTVKTQYTYDPFGLTTTSGTASTNTYEFAGRQADSSGLYFNRSRYYSPSQERFVSSDPIGFGGGDTNLFAYVRDNPTNLVDPTGEFAWVALAATCAVGAAVSAIAAAISGRKPTVGDLVGGCVLGVLLTVAAEFFAPALIGLPFIRSIPVIRTILASGIVRGALTYSPKLASKIDAFHTFPTLFDDFILKGGTVGKVGVNYVEYHLPGYVNGSKGVYELGIDWVKREITHRFFRP